MLVLFEDPGQFVEQIINLESVPEVWNKRPGMADLGAKHVWYIKKKYRIREFIDCEF